MFSSGEVVVIADPQQNKSKKLTPNLPADKNNEARIKKRREKAAIRLVRTDRSQKGAKKVAKYPVI